MQSFHTLSFLSGQFKHAIYCFVCHKRTNKSLTFSTILLHEIFLVDVQVVTLKATPHAVWALGWVQSPRGWEMLSIVPYRSTEESHFSSINQIACNLKDPEIPCLFLNGLLDFLNDFSFFS